MILSPGRVSCCLQPPQPLPGACVLVQVVIFAFFLPPFAPTRPWTDSPKKKKRSEVLNEIMEHLEEEEDNKDEDI